MKYWNKTIFDDSKSTYGNKLKTYRDFQMQYNTEMFLTLNLDKSIIKNFTKIRISNSNQGRYQKLDVKDRICKLCKVDVEDEFQKLW